MWNRVKQRSLKKTAELEANAIANYKNFLEEATEQRVKDIFEALIDVEQDHLDLTEKEL